jgi:hypothetical protein
MNAVLQDWAKAVRRLMLPNASPSSLWNTSPSTVRVGGQVAGLCGVSPLSPMRAVDVMVLNVDPGASVASRA